LIAGFALLKAGGQDLFCGCITDGDACATNFLPEHHRAMGDDAHENGRRLRIVQMEV
jgi:hypothetical protein